MTAATASGHAGDRGDRVGPAGALDRAAVSTRTPWALAALSAVAVTVANLNGVTIGDDGVGYRATADSLVHGHGLGYFLERHLTTWPPGWPGLMALVAKVTPLGTRGAAAALNAAAAFVIVVVGASYLRRVVRNRRLALGATVVLAVGANTVLLGHFLMTDLGFAAATLALFAVLARRATTDDRWTVVVAGVLVWVCFAFRYVGIVHLGTGAVWLLCTRSSVRRRIEDAVTFVVVGSVFPALWMLRNDDLNGTLLGVRYHSARGPIGNAVDIVQTLGNFLSPGLASTKRMIWLPIGVIGIAVAAALLFRLVATDERLRSVKGILAGVGTPVGLLALHVGVYTAYIWYVRSTTALNVIDFRLLNPVYLPLIICGVVVVDRLLGGTDAIAGTPVAAADARWARLARACGGAWIALSVGLGLFMTAWFATAPRLFDGNYASQEFVDVRSSAALASVPAGCTVYSNLPNGLYPRMAALWSPATTGPESDEVVHDVDDLRAKLPHQRSCLVWIDLPPAYGQLIPLAGLRRDFHLVELAHVGDVEVFRITPA